MIKQSAGKSPGVIWKRLWLPTCLPRDQWKRSDRLFPSVTTLHVFNLVGASRNRISEVECIWNTNVMHQKKWLRLILRDKNHPPLHLLFFPYISKVSETPIWKQAKIPPILTSLWTQENLNSLLQLHCGQKAIRFEAAELAEAGLGMLQVHVCPLPFSWPKMLWFYQHEDTKKTPMYETSHRASSSGQILCLTQSQVAKKCFQAQSPESKGGLLECGKNLTLIANLHL